MDITPEMVESIIADNREWRDMMWKIITALAASIVTLSGFFWRELRASSRRHVQTMQAQLDAQHDKLHQSVLDSVKLR